MDVYEKQARTLLQALSGVDRRETPIKRVREELRAVATKYPKAKVNGNPGLLLDAIRQAHKTGEAITLRVGEPPAVTHIKGPRLAQTVPYKAGKFLAGRKWTGVLREQDWVAFAAVMGYGESQLTLARAQLTAVFHGVRGWLEVMGKGA